MKPIPRIRGSMWPACVFLVLLLLLPLMAMAQEDPGTGEVPDTGEALDETVVNDTGAPSTAETEIAVEAVDTSAVEGEGAVSIVEVEPMVLPMDQVNLLEWEPASAGWTYNFQKPDNFRVVDRQSDEGGGLAVRWAPSESDASGEYEYWVFQSRTDKPGSWELVNSIASDSSYIWEDPARYGFFLSDVHKGSNEHVVEYEFYYPPKGIYSYGLSSEEDNPEVVNVRVAIFDEETPDYASLPVFVDLSAIGGEKIQLNYDPSISGGEIWEHFFTATAPWDPTHVTETKTRYMLVTSEAHGNRSAVIEAQATSARGIMTVAGGSEENLLPDNRFGHYFRLYSVPVGYFLPYFEDAPEGYVLPEGLELPVGSDLPLDEFMIGGTVGPIIADDNYWNNGRTNCALWSLLICIAVMGYIIAARSGGSLFLRRIAGLDHVEEAIGRATEMGRPILYTTGLGYVSDIATIASINILGQVARKVADYETRLMVPQRDPIVMAVCQEVVQEAYIDAGRPDAYNKDDIFFITDDQFAYTAAVNGIMVREKPATIILMGMFYAESLLLAETGASTGAIQIAGTDALAQLPFFITACDYTLIGEELYAASAYLSREPLLVGSLKGQDLAKLIFMVLTLIGTILIFANVEFVQQLFQAF